MSIDWDSLWTAMTGRFLLGETSIHGPEHWRRVERHGLQLAEHSGGSVLIVRLFAVLHDVCRHNDGSDDDHGPRAAELATLLRDDRFSLSDDDFARLHDALSRHTMGEVSADPTIGACWDADRLDIWRAGLTPRESLMSTDHARYLVRAKRFGPKHTPG